jgi:hypothetical protein
VHVDADELLETGDRLLVIAGTIAEDINPVLVGETGGLDLRAFEAVGAGRAIVLLAECARVLARMADDRAKPQEGTGLQR